MEEIRKLVRDVPDFPKPGILFYDISTLLAHPKAWHTAIERLADLIRPHKPDVLAGIESRGFLLAAPLALALSLLRDHQPQGPPFVRGRYVERDRRARAGVHAPHGTGAEAYPDRRRLRRAPRRRMRRACSTGRSP